jgi:putative membrane protein
MNAFSTAAALTVLAATTAAFAAQTQEQLSPPSRLVPNTTASPYQDRDSARSGRDTEFDANSDAESCQLKSETVKGSPAATAFASTAAQDGTVEVALAGLALRKSRNDHVRRLAQRMVQDYAQSNGELESIVKCEGLVLPTELDAKHSVAIQKLDATSGSAFDKAYLKHIAEKHSKAVALFESASRSGDPDVAAFAREGLAMLHEHQELAGNLRVAMAPTVTSMR